MKLISFSRKFWHVFLLAGVWAVSHLALAQQSALVPPAEHSAFLKSIDNTTVALQDIRRLADISTDELTTAALRLQACIDDMKSELPDVRSHALPIGEQMLERMEIMQKIARILTNVSTQAGDKREAPLLIHQISMHLEEVQRLYVSVFGRPRVHEDAAPLPFQYRQWKAEVLALTDQMKAQAAGKKWDRLARLGETIDRLCRDRVPDDFWSNISGAERELLHRDRERLALYGDILKDYAEEENLPLVLYFLEKIESTLAGLP